jgi:hypothetical protein
VLSKHGFTIPSPVRCKPTSPERLGREGEAKGKLTPCVVAAREWRVNSLADLKHTPDPCYASISHRNDGIFAERNFEQLLNLTLFKNIANPLEQELDCQTFEFMTLGILMEQG